MTAELVAVALALAAWFATLSAWTVRTLWRLDRRLVRVETHLKLDQAEGAP